MNSKNQVPEVVVVGASAGSGKTHALAKRYLRVLLESKDNPEVVLKSILAITFSNKASLEMKERIIDFLKRIALDDFSSLDYKKDILTGFDPQIAKLKAKEILDCLVKHYNFFQVKTIDSFINSFLMGSVLLINRSSGFRIKTDYQRNLLYSLDELIYQAEKNKRVFDLFEEFLDHYISVENRSSWFPRQDILQLVQFLFDLHNLYQEDFVFYKGEISLLIKLKKIVFEKIKTLSKILPQGFNSSSAKSIRTFVDKFDFTFNIADLPSSLVREKPLLNKLADIEQSFIEKWEIFIKIW